MFVTSQGKEVHVAPKVDIQGIRFGKLVVSSDTGERKGGHIVWLCKCDCGGESRALSGGLRRGYTKSCGCLRREVAANKATTHGMSEHPLYKVLHNMKQRCQNTKLLQFKDYGGRGISVCEEWQDPSAFFNWALANGWKRGLQIDRKDNDGNYEPVNCRFVTPKENSNNRRTIGSGGQCDLA
jgi:hypothetical protein